MEPQVNIARESKQSALAQECYALCANLLCGVKLLFFRRSGIERAVVSYDQIFLLIGFYSLVVFVTSYLITPYPVFDPDGLQYFGAELLITLLAGFILVKLTHNQSNLPKFLIMMYSISPFFYLLLYTVIPNLSGNLQIIGALLYMAWGLGVYFFIALLLLDQKKLKAAFLVILMAVVSYPLAGTSNSFWYAGYDWESRYDGDFYTVNQEDVYYSQYILLGNALEPIKPGVEGTTDLFFVGFGSDATQDVFMKEIGHVQGVMNQRLGTSGRSVALINNLATIDTVPLASSTNLGISLRYLGEKMNRDEDVVFLYLTSHGSQDHDLSVKMWPLDLNDLRPEHIKDHLDNAGIRWRIILVSACYSGGFIDALKDEYSLILTAAASDKTSFGCSNENEYTYFGEALFKNVQEGPYQFVPHFEQAMAEIKARELSEFLTPSDPQLFIGSMMREKLTLLEQDMAQYAPDRFVGF